MKRALSFVPRTMKSGAEVLVAFVRVRVEKEALVVPFPFPLPGRACLCFVVAAFFFDTADVDVLAGAFLAGVFLVLAMA
jgi:hypothetical protein